MTSLASTSPAWLLRSWSSGCLAKSELLRQDGQGRGKVGDCAVTDATWPQSLTASTEAAGSSQLGALVAAASLLNTVKLICFPHRSHRSRHRAQGSLEIWLNDYGTESPRAITPIRRGPWHSWVHLDNRIHSSWHLVSSVVKPSDQGLANQRTLPQMFMSVQNSLGTSFLAGFLGNREPELD